MIQLSRSALQNINSERVAMPPNAVFELPEKVIQFGTGVLLRGLPDYFIDKANRQGLFNGRIVVVKSTDAGDATAFSEQDHLYTLCIRGMEGGKAIEENIICSAISRVLSAKSQWSDVLHCAVDPAITILISNTTEVGIQLLNESIFQKPPVSFPAKLLCFLYERFKKGGEADAPELVVLPTELISDNGKKLHRIVTQLAQFNKLEAAFFSWLNQRVFFCNTLVDCIVPGKPVEAIHKEMENALGYEDALLTVSEVYRLWAIEGGAKIKTLLSFAPADQRVVITPDITKYKELKLRLLNGTHTTSCGLAFLAGLRTVKDAMAHGRFSAFVTGLMMTEIAPAIPYNMPEGEATTFGLQVLDRFRNPHLEHAWLSITVQYTSKMAMRVVPVLLRYFDVYRTVPQHIALGFAAYLLFMKSVKKEDGKYWGESHSGFYPVNDDAAAYYFDLWQADFNDSLVRTVLQNDKLWGKDLTAITGFEEGVANYLKQLLQQGALHTIMLLPASKP